ncbi:MAG: protein kinase, partial [Sandaracinaceae bacterium]|nr:protein kinase [Sandaracinaceae bacterium]
MASSPGVLHLTDVVDDAAPGPTLLFDDFAGAQRLDTFLREHPELPFDQRVDLVLSIGRALEHCHRNDVLHGALSPHAVLVRKSDSGPAEVRLHNFQLGAGEAVTPTLHRTTLLGEVGSAYQAPEVSGNPGAISPLSDLFSLGALAYLIFTGRAPARDSAELRARLRADQFLDPSAATDVLAPEIVTHVQEATAASPELRAKSSGEPWDVGGWTAHLFDLGTSPEPSEHGVLDPHDAPPDSVVAGLRIIRTLGQGATARVREVERTSDGKRFALKVSSAPEQDERLRAEAEVLDKLRHPNVVALEATLELGGRVCLLLALAGDESLQRRLQREGPLSIADAKVLGSDLLAALEALELAGVLHRDLKPANIGLGAAYSGRRAQLTLFDFSAAALPVTAVTVGTPGYRDPFLEVRKAADASADRYSAAVVLHELLTGENEF